MTTFSQLVDEMAIEVVRPDLKKSQSVVNGGYIASSINQTIREVHTGKAGSQASNGIAHRFASNRVEIEIEVDSVQDSGIFNFEIPNFNRFQAVEAVQFASIGRWAMPRPPGIVNLENRGPIDNYFYWYQSGNFLCFNGFGGLGKIIRLSTFYYPRSLVYHRGSVTDQIDPRWAEYNTELETWDYREGTGKTDEELRDLSTNWILLRWPDMIREGVRAKVYKRLGDENRQRTSYSSYESMRAEMQTQEIVQGTGGYTS